MPSNRFPLLGRMAVAFVIAVAFALLYGIAVGWLNEVRKDIARRRAGPQRTEGLVVRDDGVPLISTNYDGEPSYRTLDDEPAKQNADYAYINSNSLWGGGHKERLDYVPQSGWGARIMAFTDSANPPTYWYFVTTDGTRNGRGHFVGYDPLTRALKGYITTKGFTTVAPNSEDEFSIDGAGYGYGMQGALFRVYGPMDYAEPGQTPGKSSNRYSATKLLHPPSIVYLRSRGRFLRVDLLRRTVDEALSVDNVISGGTIGFPPTGVNVARWGAEWMVEYLLRQPDRVVVFNPADGSSAEFTIPAELRDEDFTFYSLPDGEALVNLWEWDFKSRFITYDLVWFNRAGEISKRRSVTLQARDYVQTTQEESMIGAIAVPVPFLWSVIPFVSDAVTRRETLRNFLSDTWPAALLLFVVAIAAAVATDCWQRRYALPRSYGWMAFVFLFGLPGFVGYLLHRRWPVRHPAPAPLRTGLEVFA